jgi:signal transduction histidine kinase
MSSTAPKILPSAVHPWSDALRSFSDIGFPAFVIQMTGIKDVEASIKSTARILGDNSQHLTVAGVVSELSEKFKITDSTQAMLDLWGESGIEALTGQLKLQIETASVGQGFIFWSDLINGEIKEDISLSVGAGHPRLNLTVYARVNQGDDLLILVSARHQVDNSRAAALSAKVRLAMDFTSEIALIVSLNGKVEFVNLGMVEICGREEIGGKRDIAEVLAPGSATKFAEMTTFLGRSEQPWTGELEFLNSSGGANVTANCQIGVIRDSRDHNVVGYCIAGYRKDSENFLNVHINHLNSALVESDRLSLVGRVSGHIIHEINNPVTVINGKAEKIQWLLGEVGKTPMPELVAKLGDCAVKILKMTDRINKIIAGMKNMTRNAKDEGMASVCVADFVSEVHDLVEVIAKKQNVKVEVDQVSRELKVPAQRLRVSQVLVNLFSNAIDAVSASKDRWVKLSVTADDRWVYLKVIDSGSGLPPDVKDRLFESYFTTKGVGKGTGIGLTLSRQIAREHGGDLYLDDEISNTCFVVKLPLRPAATGGNESSEAWEEI